MSEAGSASFREWSLRVVGILEFADLDSRFPSSTLLPFFFLGSLIQTE